MTIEILACMMAAASLLLAIMTWLIVSWMRNMERTVQNLIDRIERLENDY